MLAERNLRSPRHKYKFFLFSPFHSLTAELIHGFKSHTAIARVTEVTLIIVAKKSLL